MNKDNSTIKKEFKVICGRFNGIGYESVNQFYQSCNVKITPKLPCEDGLYKECLIEIEGKEDDVNNVALYMGAIGIL